MNGSLKSLKAKIGRWISDARWAGDWATYAWLRGDRRLPGVHDLTTRLHGRPLRVSVRGKTLDTDLARMILCEDSEYRLPFDMNPRVIFDIGANTGMTSVYFATRYPEARIYSFEPLPENVELLRRNVALFDGRITVVPKGLGDREGVLTFHPSRDAANFGGGTFHEVGSDPDKTLILPVTTFDAACRDLGVDRVDLVKIDTEGAEAAVLRGMSDEHLINVTAIIGELHGVQDAHFLARLFDGFDVGVNKPLDRNCYPFIARRKASAAPASGAADRRAA